jgi:RimJ/RimL family protein N-acetyltransferase
MPSDSHSQRPGWERLAQRLEGDLVVLEPLEQRHAQELFDASRDPRVWRWYLGEVPEREQFDHWLEQALVKAAAGHEVPLATLGRATGRVIGTTRYTALRPEHRSLEIGGTWLNPSTWRTGANIEAKLLMLAHVFERLHCQRIEFKADARNQRSRAALAALPAQFEGILRRHMLVPYDDGIRDSAYYSITAPEWPGVRANLTRRLAARQPSTGAAQSISIRRSSPGGSR